MHYFVILFIFLVCAWACCWNIVCVLLTIELRIARQPRVKSWLSKLRVPWQCNIFYQQIFMSCGPCARPWGQSNIFTVGPSFEGCQLRPQALVPRALSATVPSALPRGTHEPTCHAHICPKSQPLPRCSLVVKGACKIELLFPHGLSTVRYLNI